MHYIDGTEAMVGDIVRGTGYNLPYQIVGPVTKLVPLNGVTCNIRVETRVAKYTPAISAAKDGDGGMDFPASWAFDTYEEAGQCDAFELIARQGWEKVRSNAMVWEPKPPETAYSPVTHDPV